MRKGTYRAVGLELVEAGRLWQALEGRRLVAAIDVAKEDEVAALVDATGRVLTTVKWKHPGESGRFLELLSELRELGADVEAVMEPTGTYGDALRSALLGAGFRTFRVSAKRCHDAAEVYDGVRSSHDAKAAAIIGKLHLDGTSEAWPLRTSEERSLTAVARMMAVYDARLQRCLLRLGSMLVRHWPELAGQMKLERATVLELLAVYGAPAAVAADEANARALMRRVGQWRLTDEKIELVVGGAVASVGTPAVAEERRMLKELALDARQAQRAAQRARRRARRLGKEHDGSRAISEAVGPVSAVVLVASLGDPCRYRSAGAYLKAFGLNLTERSSGKKKGRLHISRRGPGMARRYLWLAAARLIHRDAVARAWYDKKVERDGGVRAKALVAVMRKLVRALWHVARGGAGTFDTRKLFDTLRLELPSGCLDVATPAGDGGEMPQQRRT